MIQKIDIDNIPPNLNETLNMAKRHWGAYYSQKKKWGKLIKDYCELSNMQPIETPVNITIQNTYPCKRRRDPDNIIMKFILDGIVEAGIIPDDTFEHINSIIIKKPTIEKKVKRTLITLETVNKTKQE